MVIQKILYRAGTILSGIRAGARRTSLRLRGMRFGRGTVSSSLIVNWPHQVAIGKDCLLEPGIFLKFDGPWMPGPSIVIGDRAFIGRGCEFNIVQSVHVGADALIGSGCKFI